MLLPIKILIDHKQPLARLLCRGDIAVLTLRKDGRLMIERQDGTQHEAEVETGTTVYPWLVILRLRIKEHVETLVLPCAATGDDAHRRLRVWLRWRASVSA